MRVPENGGTPQRILVKPDSGSWRRPDILPGGKAAIVSNPLSGVGVLSLETGEFRVLLERGGGGRYAAGHLIFSRPGVLLAAPFDLQRLVLTGPETVVLESVRTETEGVTPQPQAVFSADGTLVYASGGAPKNSTRPVWVDRRGKVQPSGMPPRSYGTMSLSPNGRFLAILIADPEGDIWVQDFELGTLTRRTFGVEPDGMSWTPDGERIIFGVRRNGKRRSLWIPRDGSSEPEPFITDDGQPALGSYSPDGRLAVTVKRGTTTGLDLWVLSLKETCRRCRSCRLDLQKRDRASRRTGTGSSTSPMNPGNTKLMFVPILLATGSGRFQAEAVTNPSGRTTAKSSSIETVGSGWRPP